MWSRRRLLCAATKSPAMFAAVPSVGSMLVGARHADGVEPHFLVFVQIYGAWDVCLAFDPKDRESRLSDGTIAFDQPYGINEVSTFGKIRLAPHGVALGRFADRLAIVNGIDMELDAGHSPTIVMTGDSGSIGSQKPFVQALVSDRHPYLRRCVIPHLYTSYDGFFSGGAFAGKTMTISRMNAHRVLFSPGGSAALRKAAASTQLAREALDASGSQKLGQYSRALSQAAILRDTLGQNGGSVAEPINTVQFGDFAAILFKRGVLGSLTWSLGETYNFDTHSDHYRAHPLKSAVDDIAAFAIRLGEVPLDNHTSVLDRTTFIVAGEYSRTPRLNSSQGKDHNTKANSLILMGHKVPSGVFGESGERRSSTGMIDAHAGLPVSFETGLPSDSGEVLKIRNVWAGAGQILGVDLSQEFGATTRPIKFFGA